MSAARTLADNRADNVQATSAFHAHQAVEKANARDGAADRVVHGASAPIGMTDTPSGRR